MSKFHKFLMHLLFNNIIKQRHSYTMRIYLAELVRMWRKEFPEDSGRTCSYLMEYFEDAEYFVNQEDKNIDSKR